MGWAEASEVGRYGRSGWSGSRDGHLSFTARENTEAIRISEEGLGSRSHWEYSNREYDRWAGKWKTPPVSRYEKGATGRLQIEIIGYGGEDRQSKWADRQSWTLEEKLGEVLREIELRGIAAEDRRREAERAAAEREQQWEAAMVEAKDRWFEAHRGKLLERQAEAWGRAELLRAYADEMAERATGDGTEEWVAWSRDYADAIDPLRDGVQAPEVPESVPLNELSPFLDGWSPYGADRGPHGWGAR